MSDITNIEMIGTKYNLKDQVARASVLELNEHIDNDVISKLQIATNSRFITVGKTGASFTSINSAIAKANEMGYNVNQPIAIFIEPGIYNEQLVLNNGHGLSFIGCGIDKTIIKFNGSYPDCVIHCQGDYSFSNMTIENINNETYAVHIDPVDQMISGTMMFEHCKIVGGSSAIGYGSGQDMHLIIKDCILSGTQNILYAHNSSYQRTGQSLEVSGCMFKHTTEEHVFLLDDAGYTNGGTNSPMRVVMSNNTHDISGYPKVMFRKSTAISSTWLPYIPANDSNILFGPGSDNNSGINGMNFYMGKVDISEYMVLPSSPDSSGIYRTSVVLPIDANNYNVTLNSVVLPGVGDVTSFFNIGTRNVRRVTVETSNSAYAGKSMSISLSAITI